MAKSKLVGSCLFLLCLFLAFATFFTMLPRPASAASIPSLPCDFYGDEAQSGTLMPGNIVSTKDPDGVICGSTFVTNSGTYGFLTGYPDDLGTTGIDEGAIEGDIMSFYLNSAPALNTAIWSSSQTVRSDITFTADSSLDNAYQFLYDQMDKYILPGEENVPRLIESFAAPYPYTPSGDPILEGEAFVYDNALAMIAFLVRGTQEDMRRAKVIGEAFVQLANSEPDGRIRDVYKVDNIYNMQPTWGGDGSGCGNMAWIINALIQYYKRDPYQPFFDTALTLANFVENEYKGSFSDDIPGGYINGWAFYGGSIQKMTYKVTEHNIITHAAFMRLYEIMKENDIPGYNDWYQRAQWAKSFVTDQMWYETWGMYLAGTKYEKVLDANSHAIMVFNDPVRNPQILSWLENNVLMTHDGFTGFAFDNLIDGVWFEGTAYMGMVYQMMNDIPNSNFYLGEVERAQTTALGANGYGIVSACHNQVQTYFHELFSSPHIAATASYLCAKQGYNVLWMIPNGVNTEPLANAGEEQEVYVTEPAQGAGAQGEGQMMALLEGASEAQQSYIGTTVTLDGSLSWDYNNDSLTYSWIILQKPVGSTADLDNSNAVNPTFIADVVGDYVIQLIVNDGGIDSPPDTVTITAVPNNPPVLDRPIPDQIANEHEEIRFTVTSTDPDADIPIYSIEEVPWYPFPLNASIDSVSGEFVWIPTFDAPESCKVRIKVADGYGGEDYEDITITVNDISVTRVGLGQEHTTIQDAIDDPLSENIIYVYAGAYQGDVILKNGKTLIGENLGLVAPYHVILEGNVICMESNSTIESVDIIYREGSSISFTNAHYDNLSLLADAGITAIDSEITVKNCIIMPDLDTINYEGDYDPPLEHYGKGIQIWNMYGSTEKTPTIKNNLILNADTGIYLFSQAFGGTINGEISNNTLDQNKYGIVLRMHKENPLIKYNIITNCERDAIHFTYEDGSLLTNRLSNVTGNDFFGNSSNIWCDSLQTEVTPTGPGNIYEDPEYADPLYLDYTPLNPACEGKGFVLE